MWTSPNGTPLSDATIARVDLDILAELYAAETADDRDSDVWDRANQATLYAWDLGYRNPRVP
jgi:hypothetical protein